MFDRKRRELITLLGGAAAVLLALLMLALPVAAQQQRAWRIRLAARTRHDNRYTPFAVDTEKGASLNPTLWQHRHHV
jgi:hypothetical protein